MDESVDVGAAYRELRLRMLELVGKLTAQQWEQPVPHCEPWSIRELFAHLAGVVDDGINANMAGVATPEWTAAHIAKREHQSGPDIATEWTTWAPFVEARATERGLALSQLLFDATSHEHDLRFALGAPGARSSDAVQIATWFLVSGLVAQRGGSPIGLIVDGVERVGGARCVPDAPVLRASSFDVLRSLGSRRSRAQVEALDWSSPPSASVLAAIVPFGYPTASLDESDRSDRSDEP